MGDLATQAVLDALRGSLKLAYLARYDFAERLAVHCSEHGHKGPHTLAEVIRSLGEADAKVADLMAAGESPNIVPMVTGFVRRGPRPEPARPAPARARSPRDVQPDVDPEYEAREAEAHAAFTAERRAKTEADKAAGKDVTW